ncbi:hypothetical protein RCO28_15510 [Streptomyces sp. LHD-70]|uniref:hypothetical protein n=1 Tax=Streptomyces sp. LHD-70 TaxID=3072140 RepID=UPI0028102427|nr:hypothetical protein [Streptomyces sp. LHD-70]MDQ8703889.1 hypothetical protein [Streptomyces sp. LHD-70]
MIERTIYPEQIGAMIAALEPDAISHTEPLAESEDRYLPGTVAFTVHNSAATTALSRRRG